MHNIALLSYLRNITTDSNFAIYVLKILITDRRAAHREQRNEEKSIYNLKVGNLVKPRVQVNSTASKGLVSKLIYKVKGPFIITSDLGNNIFIV